MFAVRSALALYVVVVGYVLPVAETWQAESSEESLKSMWLGVLFLEGFAVPLSQLWSEHAAGLQAALVRCAYLSLVVFDLLATRRAVAQLCRLLRAAAMRCVEGSLCSAAAAAGPAEEPQRGVLEQLERD